MQRLLSAHAFTLAQLARAGQVLVVGILLARAGQQQLLYQLESLAVAVGLASAALVTAAGQYLLAQYPKLDGDDRTRHLSCLRTLALLAGALSVVLFLAMSWAALPKAAPQASALLVTAALLPSAFLALYRLAAERRPVAQAWLAALSSLLWVGAGLTNFIDARPFWGLLAAASLLQACVLWVGNGGFTTRGFTSYLRQLWPLVQAAFFASGLVFVNAFLVELLTPEQSFVQYRLGSRELPLMLIVFTSLAQQSAGQLPQQAGAILPSALSALKQRVRSRLLLFAVLNLLLLVFSEQLFAGVYGKSYAPAAAFFDVFLLLLIPRALLPQSLLLALDARSVLARISRYEFIIHALLFVLLWPWLGMLGATWALFVAYCLEKALLIRTVRQRGYAFASYTPAALWLATSILLPAAYTAKQLL